MALGAGPYFGAFSDAYLRSRELGRRESRQGLDEAMALEQIRRQAQEQTDMGLLASAFQARRRAMAGGPPLPAGQSLPMPIPEPMAQPPVAAGLGIAPGPAGTAGSAGAAMPPSATIAPGATPGAPAGEALRRESLLTSMAPDVAGRLLRSPGGRSAIKDLEAAEQEHETQENRKKAETLFGEATKAMKDGDALSYYDHAAKAMRVLGNYQAAAQYTEHAMNLRGDDKESKAANEDLGRWLKANTAYTNDPSPENYASLLKELGEANAKGSRALRGQIIDNVLKKTFNQNPKVTSFSRAVAGAYRDAFSAGKEPNAEGIFRAAAGQDPEGFNAYIYDALANQKALPEVVMKKLLRWDVVDGKEIPQNIYGFAFAETQARFSTLRKDDPKFMEAWWQAIVRKTKETAESKTKPEDTEKGIRADVSEIRKRLSDVRGELRRSPGMAEEDPERYRELREEEQQVKADLEHQESRMRKQTGAPAPKGEPVQIPVNAPNPKLKPDTDKYKQQAMGEINRLKQAGYGRDQIKAMMFKAGWQ